MTKNKFLLLIALVLSLAAHSAFADLGAFKQKIQVEIVKGMEIANNDKNPIVYGEQGGQGTDFKGQLDTAYWQKVGNYAFVLKPGKSASRAIDAIFPTKPTMKEVRLECHSMMIAIIYRAMKEALGEEKFDQIFSRKLVIKYGDLDASGLTKFFLRAPVPKSQMEVGDWVYFQNHDSYLHKHPDGPWQGENAIFVGKKGRDSVYSGFGAANLTEREMLKELQDAYNEAQTRGDKDILQSEWKKLLTWLVPNSIFKKQNYFQLSPKLFKKIPARVDPEDIIDDLFAPVAKNLGFASVASFSTEFEYGVDEVPGGHIFWVEKINPYEASITISDIPGLARIDRLDYQKLYSLRSN
ncbi:MAG TPA: hypothetical protein VNJ01_07360 [Bacteriovoracaceae bacterium]|nr:hypothetical protein [Bacteriovoracaceae bacterium]